MGTFSAFTLLSVPQSSVLITTEISVRALQNKTYRDISGSYDSAHDIASANAAPVVATIVHRAVDIMEILMGTSLSASTWHGTGSANHNKYRAGNDDLRDYLTKLIGPAHLRSLTKCAYDLSSSSQITRSSTCFVNQETGVMGAYMRMPLDSGLLQLSQTYDKQPFQRDFPRDGA